MNYKLFIVVPVVVLVVMLSYLLWLNLTSGLNLDIDLKGGTQITAESSSEVSAPQLESVLKQYDASVRISRGLDKYSVFIEFSTEVDPDSVLETLSQNGYSFENHSVQTVGTSLGQAFFGQAFTALILAFVFMAGAAFVIFKKPVLSLRLIFSASADIIETIALSQLIGIKLSLATFAAVLLLLGYSADDDIMMTARTTRGSGSIPERMKRAMKTAFTTVGTTVVALFALFVIVESPVIDQIASIMLIGLLFDLINTWMFNAPILRWYVEKGMK